MISVGVRELREELSKYLQRVRDEGETIEITVRGEPVARVIPMKAKPRSPEEIAELFAAVGRQLIEEIRPRMAGRCECSRRCA